MRPVTAATVTLEDLSKYFKGEHWRSVEKEGGLEGRSDSYSVFLKPKDFVYAVEIHAYEDEGDGDEEVTDDPLRFLVDFLKTGHAGDEALDKMAGVFSHMNTLPPDGLISMLRIWANAVDTQEIGPADLGKLLRRAAILVDMKTAKVLLTAAVRLAQDQVELEPHLKDIEVKDHDEEPGPSSDVHRNKVETAGMEELVKKMSEKGWRAKLDTSDRGSPEVTVDIAGIYEAKIEIDHISWHYEFEVNGTDVHDEGITDDPISMFRNFYRSDAVQSAKKGLYDKPKEKQEEATKPPSHKRKKPPTNSDFGKIDPFAEGESGAPQKRNP